MRKILLILFLGLSYFIFDLLTGAGFFKTIGNSFDGEVTQVYNEMAGPEDLDVDVSTGILYISSDDRWASGSGNSVQGSIFSLQIDSAQSVPHQIPTDYTGDFHPHGISFLSIDSTKFLFVINHTNKGDYVERFLLRNDSLIHERSFSDVSMCCPNDLVAVDSLQFYVTNDHGNKFGFMRKMEDYLRLPMSYVLFYDGEKFVKVVEDLSYANGINVSEDNQILYLSATTSGMFYTFKRDTGSGSLSLLNSVDLQTGLDNIHIDTNGEIWIGAHPKLLDFVGHSKSSDNKSPSQVLRLIQDGDGYKVKEVYLNDGHELSGSSVAVPYKDELFIGVVFENKVLRGKLH